MPPYISGGPLVADFPASLRVYIGAEEAGRVPELRANLPVPERAQLCNLRSLLSPSYGSHGGKYVYSTSGNVAS